MEGQTGASREQVKLGRTPSTQRATSEPPVSLLPEELLVCIFKILVKYNPISVGRLLLVSRYWHHIVQMTPSLWSNILINPRSSREIVSYNHYVTRALVKSGNLPLDVAIDLDHLYSYLEFRRVSPNKVDTNSLFRDLFGHKGEHVVRWRSFRFRILPEQWRDSTADPWSGLFVKGLYYSTPHLESLFLSAINSDECFPHSGGSLQDLPSLRHLSVDAGGHLGNIRCSPEKIQTLSFRLWSSTNVLAPFTNLRELSIGSIPYRGANHKGDPVITFPLLECLTLEVWVVDVAKELILKIRAPILNTLRLLYDNAILSVADAAAFHHIRALELLSNQSHPAGILEFLASQLRDYTMLTSLTVCSWHLNSVMQCLNTLEGLGRLPVGLDVVYTVVSNKDGVTLELESTKKMWSMWRFVSDYIYRSHPLDSFAAGRLESVTPSQQSLP